MNTKLFKAISILAFVAGVPALISSFALFIHLPSFLALIMTLCDFFFMPLCLAGFVSVRKQEKVGELQKSNYLLSLVSSALFLLSTTIAVVGCFAAKEVALWLIIVCIVCFLAAGGYFATTLVSALKCQNKLLVINNMDAPASNGELLKVAAKKFLYSIIFILAIVITLYTAMISYQALTQPFLHNSDYERIVYPFFYTVYSYVRAGLSIIGAIFGIIAYVCFLNNKQSQLFYVSLIIFLAISTQNAILISPSMPFVFFFLLLPLIPLFKNEKKGSIQLSASKYVFIGLLALLIIPLGMVFYKISTHSVLYRSGEYSRKVILFDELYSDEKVILVGSQLLMSMLPLVAIVCNLLQKKPNKGATTTTCIYALVTYVLTFVVSAANLHANHLLDEVYANRPYYHHYPMPGDVKSTYEWILIFGAITLVVILVTTIFFSTKKANIEEVKEERKPLARQSLFSVISKSAFFVTCLIIANCIPMYTTTFNTYSMMYQSVVNLYLETSAYFFICLYSCVILSGFFVFCTAFIQFNEENKKRNRIINIIAYSLVLLVLIVFATYISNANTYSEIHVYNLMFIHIVLVLFATFFCLFIDYYPFTSKKVELLKARVKVHKDNKEEKRKIAAQEQEVRRIQKEKELEEKREAKHRELEERERMKEEARKQKEQEELAKKEKARKQKEQEELAKKEKARQEELERQQIRKEKETKADTVSNHNLSSGDKISQLKELKALYDSEAIDEEEYKQLKSEILGGGK